MTPDLPFTRAAGTVRLAKSFSEAAARQPLDVQPQPFVTYFLLAHALELAWKAVLIAEGVSEKALRAIGHDLREARRRAEALLGPAVTTTPEIAVVTEMMADYYKAKALEYLEPGYYSLPQAAQALPAVGEYVEALSGWVDKRVRCRLRSGDVYE